MIGNYPLNAFSGIDRLPKLSGRDGQVHCVFKGWIPTENLAARKTSSVFNQTLDYVPIWEALAEKGVHIHIYSYISLEYCRSLELKSKFIHCEGNLHDEAPVSRLTQYDVGWLLYKATNLSAECGEVERNSGNPYLRRFLPNAWIYNEGS